MSDETTEHYLHTSAFHSRIDLALKALVVLALTPGAIFYAITLFQFFASQGQQAVAP